MKKNQHSKKSFTVPLKLLTQAENLTHAELIIALRLHAWGELSGSRHLAYFTPALTSLCGKGKVRQTMQKLHQQRIIHVQHRYKHYSKRMEALWYIKLIQLPIKAYSS